MFDAMEHGELRTLYVLGENPAQSEADSKRALALLESLDFMIAQDILFTKTCEMADVVLPSSASWCESDGGTVTNSERRVQLMRKALDPPGQARDDGWIICELARRLGHDWGQPTSEEAWDELPLHAVDLRPQGLQGSLVGVPLARRPCHVVQLRDPPRSERDCGGCELGDGDTVGMSIAALWPKGDDDLRLDTIDVACDARDGLARVHVVEGGIGIVEKADVVDAEHARRCDQFRFTDGGKLPRRRVAQLAIPPALTARRGDQVGLDALPGIPRQRPAHSQRLVVGVREHRHETKLHTLITRNRSVETAHLST